MIFYFNTEGDTLTLLDIKNKAYTKNVNSYLCKFDLDDSWDNLTAFAVFITGDLTYTITLSEDNSCFIPHEVLQNEGTLEIGLFGTNADESDLKRISTNTRSISVSKGAHPENTEEIIPPHPDTWELLINRNIPKIGENGNWYIWDIDKKDYVDTNMPSKATTPQKGIDYFTKEDIEALNIPSVDSDFDDMSENAISNKSVTKAFSETQKMFYPKNISDARYLLKKEVFFDGNHISAINDYTDNTTPLNYRIYGNSKQSVLPTTGNPQEILFVGDLVTDEKDFNYGKYKVSYTFNGIDYAVYLNEPLRGITGYGASPSNTSEQFFYTLDYIDFKNQQVIRNVREIQVTEFPKPIITIYKHADKLWLRSSILFEDNVLIHPSGNNQISDVLSNTFQRMTKTNGSNTATDNYIFSPNNSQHIYFYWCLDSFGLTAEQSTSDDYTVRTSDSTTFYKVKNSEGSYLSLSQIQYHINKHYQNSDIRLYYPSAGSVAENITLMPLTAAKSDSVDFSVNTYLSPTKISLEYHTDISSSINKINKQLENLENSILSLGGIL